MSVAQVPWAERLSPAHLRRHGLERSRKNTYGLRWEHSVKCSILFGSFSGCPRGAPWRARFVIKKRIFSIENKYCLHFPRFSFSDSGFFSCSQTKSQGSASRYIVCISSYPEQVEFSSVCMCQHSSFLHFLRRLDKRTFSIRAA